MAFILIAILEVVIHFGFAYRPVYAYLIPVMILLPGSCLEMWYLVEGVDPRRKNGK